MPPAGRSGTIAPVAPGRLGVALQPKDAFDYLNELGTWLEQRRQDLQALDSAALASSDRDAFSRDMIVAMALSKAISDRYDLLRVTFDSGRVGPREAERLSTLVWGRLDVAPDSPAGGIAPSTAGALALSLPEACRLLDAMVSSLRSRLGLEPAGAEVATRLKDLRATIERIRDQVGVVPAGPERDRARADLQRLEQRAVDVGDRARRGADVGGLLAPLEYAASGLERDLIVGAGTRADDARDAQRAHQLYEELRARGDAIRDLEARCVAAVAPAPRLAVPDVSALGPIPASGAALDAYLDRLDAVSRALTLAHGAYTSALAEREEIDGLSGALAAQAAATGVDDADLAGLRERVTELLRQRPTDVARARAWLAAYRAFLTALTTKEGRR